MNITYLAHEAFPFNVTRREGLGPFGPGQMPQGKLDPNPQAEALVKGAKTVGDVVDKLES